MFYYLMWTVENQWYVCLTTQNLNMAHF